MNRDRQFIVELQQDVASGELILTVPEAILNDMGWYEGTQLEWIPDGDEYILLDATDA